MFEKILAASQRLAGQANQTPVMTSKTLNEITGARVFLKCENFQKIGAFKFRGAFNAISQLSAQEKQKGVLAYSSGNHAQAVALVGRMLAVQTTIVMPENAPATKMTATAGYGATIVTYKPGEVTREAVAEELQQQHGFTLIPPFNHPAVIAGQGTAALDLFREVDNLDLLLVPCGGGGLLSGSSVAAKNLKPDCKVIGIEPALADDATRSFQTGTIQTIKNPQTIADGTRTESIGDITFALMQEYVDDMRTVTEAAIVEAVRFLFYRMKLVVEPSGALPIAALLSGVVKTDGNVGVIISGGNIDGPTMMGILAI